MVFDVLYSIKHVNVYFGLFNPYPMHSSSIEPKTTYLPFDQVTYIRYNNQILVFNFREILSDKSISPLFVLHRYSHVYINHVFSL